MISIITIVKNDPGIENTLKALEEIAKPEPIEIIVVDASEGTLDFIRDKFPKVKWIAFKAKKNKPTIPEQRNVGIKAAKGNPIIFIDANCIPEKNWLIELHKEYKKGEKIVIGSVTSIGETHSIQIGNNPSVKSGYVEEFASINLLIDKSVFKKIGMFDETFRYSSDTDLSWRAIAANYKIKFTNKAVITHEAGNYRENRKRAFNYGFGRVMLLKKHPDKRMDYLKKNYLLVVYSALLLGLPIAFYYPSYLTIFLILVLSNYRFGNGVNIFLERYWFIFGMIKALFTQKD